MGVGASGATMGQNAEQTTCNYDKKQHEECKKSVANYEQMITDYTTLIDKSKKDQEVLNFNIAELEAELNNSNIISKESKEKIKDLEKQLKEYEKVDVQIKDLEDKLSKAEINYKNAQNKLTEMDANYKAVNTNYKDTQKKLTETETNYKNTQKKLTETETNQKNTQKKLTDMEAKYKTANNNYNTANNNYKKLNDRINRLKTACKGSGILTCNTSKVYSILQEKFTPNGSSCSSTTMYCIIALVIGILIGAWLFGSHKQSVYRDTVIVEPINDDIEYRP